MLKENMTYRANYYRVSSSFLCLIFIVSGNSTIVEGPADTVTRVGDSTFLRCASDTPGDIHWYHFPAGSDTSGRNYVYAYGKLFSLYKERFRVEHESSSGTSNLIIAKVELNDAGLFACQESAGKGETAEAQLTVIESDPVCVSNINPNGFIGPNDCGLQPDYIDLLCVVYYKGSVAPIIKWKNVQEGKTYAINQSHSKRDDNRDSISCNYRTQIDTKMDGASFACNVIQTANGQFKCNTDVVKVHYATKTNYSQITKVVGDSVICSVKTSASDVNYKWMRKDYVGEVLVSEDKTLEITQPGLYLCKIDHHLKHHECSATAMKVMAYEYNIMSLRYKKTPEFPAAKISNVTIASLAVAFTLLLGLLMLVFVGFLCCKRRKRRKRHFNKKATEDCEESDRFLNRSS